MEYLNTSLMMMGTGFILGAFFVGIILAVAYFKNKKGNK